MTRKFIEEWEEDLDPTKARADLAGLSLEQLRDIPFEDLGRFKQAGKFPHGYSQDALTFYSPRDPEVHVVIIWTLLQATISLAVNMYGFDDPQAAAIIRSHTENNDVAVTLSLDKSQAGGKAAKTILETFNHDLIGNSIAIGRSSRGDISHDKLLVVDGHYLITGSTNWSYGGEELQDNQLTLTRDPLAAAEARTVIDMDHDDMLKQMAKQAQVHASP
jgi:phosphatidylserine/phosphatidylglycerophosphate/cardiolipin synthase-like enzyme